MKNYTITITVLRRNETDLQAMKDLINVCLYRAFQIRFERNFNPPDKWTLTIPDCNESAKDSLLEKTDRITKLYGTKITTWVTE